MDEMDDPALAFETLAAALRLDQKQAKDLVESLATMLTLALPETVTVTRGGWLLSKEKPVQELLVKFDEFHYQILRERSGTYSARALKVVRGIALKSTDCDLDSCFADIVKEVSKLAGKNARTRESLSKFITGA